MLCFERLRDAPVVGHSARVTTMPGAEAKQSFMKLVRQAAKPFAIDGWQVGSSGLRRQDPNGHWAHFWFMGSQWNHPFELSPVAGTVCPYLWRIATGKQSGERLPAAAIAIHSSLQPLESDIYFVVSSADVAKRPSAFPDTPVLTPDTAPGWLSDRFADFLPRLIALSSDEALLRWLADPAEDPLPTREQARLRYAALLARHLRRDDEVGELLARAKLATERTVADAERRGVSLAYQSDDQDTYPQDWSHDRFCKFLEASPVD